MENHSVSQLIEKFESELGRKLSDEEVSSITTQIDNVIFGDEVTPQAIWNNQYKENK